MPAERREQVAAAIAVAGTATSCAAIDLELMPYDPDRVEGHVLELGVLEEMLARLAAMPLAERRQVPGLHPDRASTIVAGVIILSEVLRAFGLEQVEVSERDILWGVALETAAGGGRIAEKPQDAVARPPPHPPIRGVTGRLFDCLRVVRRRTMPGSVGWSCSLCVPAGT